jgi:hypothetical protein
MERLRAGDAHAHLVRALAADAAAAGCTLAVERAASRPWASATFTGEQQRLSLALVPPAAARRWLDAIGEAELPMRGHVAMPPSVDAVEERDGSLLATLSVLTLDDA